MSRSDEQWAFLLDVAKLIQYAESKGYKLTGGELKRTDLQQMVYVKAGLSQTRDSMHLLSLAIDFNIFFDWDGDGDKDYINTDAEFKAIGTDLGDYWCSLYPRNTCGFKWGWDQGHFERRLV